MRKILSIVLTMLALSSCNVINSLLHDDQLVASVGKHKLYRSQLDAYLPSYISAEDSARLAGQYINNWASDLLFDKLAQDHLSPADKDVTAELDSYRRSLLKYRYEQQYVNSRLDTLITDEQIKEYYEKYPDLFTLPRPILKARYIDVMSEDIHKDAMLRLLPSLKGEDMVMLDSLAYSYAVHYLDYSAEWVDAAVLAREFSMEYPEMLSLLDDSRITVESKERGDIRIAYVFELQRSGVAPLQYCESTARDLILNSRKHELLRSLERDLLEVALERKDFVIY